jgi:multidrug resistance efflux pump
MNTILSLRLLATAALLTLAGLVGWSLWVYYMDDPWTRDGRVRADVVHVTPDVSGLIDDVLVHDNQRVHVGDVLFIIDRSRYRLALAQAQGTLASSEAAMIYAKAQDRRLNSLSDDAVARDNQQSANAAAAEANAAYSQAKTAVALATLNLNRATVRATVNGIITNFSMQPGDYAVAGTPVAALVDTDSLYVDGFFEETKLRRIQIHDKATVTLMSGGPPIQGHVQGIAAGIADQDLIQGPNLLADVNPIFTWVRLASRVPVRIAIDKVPPGTDLVAGITATVSIEANR